MSVSKSDNMYKKATLYFEKVVAKSDTSILKTP